MSVRSIVILVLLLASAGVSIAAAATSFSSDPAQLAARPATAQQYEGLKSGLAEQRIDLQFLLLHARLHSDAELGDELDALASSSAGQAAALAEIEPPPSMADLVDVLQTAVAEQTVTLRRVARRARSDGPQAARAATAALLAQTERILQARRRLETSFLIGS